MGSNLHSDGLVYGLIENSLSGDTSPSGQLKPGKSPTIFEVLLELRMGRQLLLFAKQLSLVYYPQYYTVQRHGMQDAPSAMARTKWLAHETGGTWKLWTRRSLWPPEGCFQSGELLLTSPSFGTQAFPLRWQLLKRQKY